MSDPLPLSESSCRESHALRLIRESEAPAADLALARELGALGFTPKARELLLHIDRVCRQHRQIEAEVYPRIDSGELTIKRAVEAVRRHRVPIYPRVYLAVCQYHRLREHDIQRLARELGVHERQVKFALALKRRLLADRDLFERWQGLAIAGCLSVRRILRHIREGTHDPRFPVCAPRPANH